MRKGKKTFSAAEAREIRQLIEEKLVAPAGEQKRIRDQIRKLGFYISDFTNKKGYTSEDFDQYTESKG